MLPFREDVHFLLPGRYLGVLAVQVPRLQNFLIYLGDPWNRFCNLISKVPVFPPLASKELRSLFFWYCSLHWPEIATCCFSSRWRNASKQNPLPSPHQKCHSTSLSCHSQQVLSGRSYDSRLYALTLTCFLFLVRILCCLFFYISFSLLFFSFLRQDWSNHLVHRYCK